MVKHEVSIVFSNIEVIRIRSTKTAF